MPPMKLLSTSFGLLAALTLVACGDDTSTSGGGGSGGSGGSGGAGGVEETCEDKGGTCLPIPAGFLGPIELSDSGATSCTNEAFEGTYAGEPYEALPAECNCACTAEGACSLAVEVHTDTACMDGATAVPLASGDCVAAPASTLSVSFTATPGACASDDAPAFVPSIKFDPAVVGCNVNLDNCEDGIACVPSTRKYCFYSETQTACPEGFVEQLNVIRREDYADDRSCTCDCGSDGIACDPVVELHDAAACASNDSTDVTDGCVTTTSGDEAVSIFADAGATGDCTLTEAETGGVVQATDGILVCCAL